MQCMCGWCRPGMETHPLIALAPTTPTIGSPPTPLDGSFLAFCFLSQFYRTRRNCIAEQTAAGVSNKQPRPSNPVRVARSVNIYPRPLHMGVRKGRRKGKACFQLVSRNVGFLKNQITGAFLSLCFGESGIVPGGARSWNLPLWDPRSLRQKTRRCNSVDVHLGSSL